MTPGARVSAAIECLDRILDGEPTEKALTNWARGARYAGSGDRAAVRDYVFQAIRCRRSYAVLGGAETGRGLMIGALCAADQVLEEMFSGLGHAPSVLSEDEKTISVLDEASPAVRLDLPDWMVPELKQSLGADFEAVSQVLQSRAPIFFV